MRAPRILCSATLLCGAVALQSINASAVSQPPAETEQAEQQPSPALTPESEEKANTKEPGEEGEKPEEVVEQKSHKSPDEASESSSSEAESEVEDKPLTEQQLADAKAILSTSEQIVLAYEKGDAETAAARFTEDAEYVDESGNVYRGRVEIQRLLNEYFTDHPSCRLEIDVDSIRFVGTGVAMEDGETTVTHRDHMDVTGDSAAVKEDKHSTLQETVGQENSLPGQQPTEAQDQAAQNGTPTEPSKATSEDVDKSDSATENNRKKLDDEAPADVQASINSQAIDPSILQNAQSGHPDGNSASVRCRYSAVYTNVDGKWLLASVRDFPHEDRREHHAQLQSLDWLQGDWVDESEDSLVHFSCEPTDNGNFLIRTFSIVLDGHEAFSGTQRIGWCPVSGKLRAWIFDSEGGYADGFWRQDGEDWVMKCTGVTADGEAASYTSVYRRLNDHTVTWQCIDYELAGELQPDSEVFTMVQTPPTPAPSVADDGR